MPLPTSACPCVGLRLLDSQGKQRCCPKYHPTKNIFFFSDCPSKTPDIKCPLVLQSRWGLRKDQGPPLTPPPGFCTSSDPQRVAWYSIMGGILGMLPGPSIAYTLQGSCPRPQPLPSLKLQQNEGTMRGLGTGIQETKTADPDKKANGTECTCPARVPDSTRV